MMLFLLFLLASKCEEIKLVYHIDDGQVMRMNDFRIVNANVAQKMQNNRTIAIKSSPIQFALFSFCQDQEVECRPTATVCNYKLLLN